ncbi:MAG: four helix bundle protein [Bacteroidales bacterium]|nr:four helix bundle protein [Bacteroidales bacterium]
MNGESIVGQKSFSFAVRIVKLCQYLVTVKKEYVISKQLSKSGTSIGANVSEALCGISRKDFLAKMYIAYKESAESYYWLKLLFACDYLTRDEYESLASDAQELLKMLACITKTTRRTITSNS